MPNVTLTNTYDGNDNRTAVSDNLSPAGSMSFSYDAAERMTAASLSVSGSAVAQITLGYDAASRLTLISRRTTGTDKTDTSHTFDDADRLTGITHQFIPRETKVSGTFLAAREAELAMSMRGIVYWDLFTIRSLQPTYVGPVPWYFDHGVIEVCVTTLDEDGNRHTVACFYIDRSYYGGEDHIFFEWPSTLIYPGSEEEREHHERRNETIPLTY